MGIDVVVADLADGLPDGDLCGVLVQYPGASGRILDPRPVIEATHERGALAVVAADLLALTLLESPGELGADVVVGSSQRFGVPLFYGGPHAGFMSVAAGLERHLPGRLVGVSLDAEGRPAYRLALQTREQHIRRDKATSNICTAQVLLAVVASMYAVYHGPEGLRADRRAHPRVRRARWRGRCTAGGRGRARPLFFDTVLSRVPGRAAEIVAAARALGVHLRLVDADHVGVSRSARPPVRQRHRGVLRAFGVTIGAGRGGRPRAALPVALRRTTPYLTHEVFSATAPRPRCCATCARLSARDYALDRGMIPLGSCTMKLNATTEMEPVSMPGFADLHPFAPADDAEGYRELIDQLEQWLAEVTGYDRVSIQPNAGSQGELAGLLAIRGYHRARGDEGRTVCLIPSSAHGTNAASAVMAGMQVVVVKAADDGSVDLDDLRAAVRQARRHPRRDHGHLPVDARRLRGHHHRALPDRARRRRPGLRRRRQPQRPARPRPARRVRRRRLPPQPAQDLLHPARRRRPRRRSGRRARPPGAVPPVPRAAPRPRAARGHRRDQRRAVRLGGHPADLVGLHPR